jgi:2-polyprenyl-3-methyl-5-hydroxy-6-metoxy-1,4-benzoquinol methylase
MQYELIKRSLGRYSKRSPFLRKTLFVLLDLLLLRTWHVRKALNMLSRHLPEDASVLDAGSGFGQYTWRMSRKNRKWKIKAVDLNEEHINDSKKFFSEKGMPGNITFMAQDLTTLNETDAFNLILSVDVMEHIAEDEKVFRAFCRSLKDGGYLLISTPSDKGGSDVHNEGDVSFIDEHVRNGYSKVEISGKLLSAGFSKTDIKYTYGFPGHISWIFSMKYPVKMLNLSRLFFIVLPFYYLIIFPFCIILNFMDLYFIHKSGTGLLVTARK